MWYIKQLKVELLCEVWWVRDPELCSHTQFWPVLLQGAHQIPQGLWVQLGKHLSSSMSSVNVGGECSPEKKLRFLDYAITFFNFHSIRAVRILTMIVRPQELCSVMRESAFVLLFSLFSGLSRELEHGGWMEKGEER